MSNVDAYKTNSYITYYDITQNPIKKIKLIYDSSASLLYYGLSCTFDGYYITYYGNSVLDGNKNHIYYNISSNIVSGLSSTQLVLVSGKKYETINSITISNKVMNYPIIIYPTQNLCKMYYCNNGVNFIEYSTISGSQ